MATTMGYLNQFLPQEFSRVVYDTVRKASPLFQKIRETYEGVSSDEVSASWRVQHTYTTSVAGAYRFRSAQGHTLAGPPATGTAVRTLGQGNLQTWVSFTDSVSPGDVQKAVQLVEANGTMALPYQILRADRLSAMIGKKVAQLMRGTARNIAQTESNAFFSPRSGSLVGDLGDVSANFSQGVGATAILTLDTSLLTNAQFDSRISRFVPGMSVDFFDTDSAGDPTTKRNTLPWVITSVDYIHLKTIVFESIDGVETLNPDTSLVDNDAIFPAGYSGTTGGSTTPVTATNLPFGYRDWIRQGDDSAAATAAANLLFDAPHTADGAQTALSLKTYPWYKSLVQNEGSVFLSQALLNKRFGAFWDAYAGLYKCTHAFMTAGVLNGYIAGIDSLVQYDRGTGAVLRLKEGFVGLDYTYMGRPIEFMVDPAVPSGEFVALDLEDANITRYTAPPLPGAGSDQTIGRVEFLAPALNGSSGIWHWASMTDASGVVRKTDFMEAPFTRVYNIAPSRIPAIRLTGLQESI